MRSHTFTHFVIALWEALLKCLPLFVIQLLAIYPLVAVGQGREAMRVLFDSAPTHISWFFISSLAQLFMPVDGVVSVFPARTMELCCR